MPLASDGVAVAGWGVGLGVGFESGLVVTRLDLGCLGLGFGSGFRGLVKMAGSKSLTFVSSLLGVNFVLMAADNVQF